MEFIKNFLRRVAGVWWLWLIIFFENLYEDSIHDWIIARINSDKNKILIFIEKIFDVPSGIGTLLFFTVFIILLVKSYSEIRKAIPIKSKDRLRGKDKLPLQIEFIEGGEFFLISEKAEGSIEEGKWLTHRIMLHNVSSDKINDISVVMEYIRDDKSDIIPPQIKAYLPLPLIFINYLDDKQKKFVEVYSYYRKPLNRDINIGGKKGIPIEGKRTHTIKISITSPDYAGIISKKFLIGLENQNDGFFNPFMKLMGSESK